MASRLTGSQKIRLEREILTSGVTLSSRDSTRHRNAAEQTILEQKLHDLDLQRRKSMQAIESEQEKSLLRFLKTTENNKLRRDKNSMHSRKTSLDKQSIEKTSKPKDTLISEDGPPHSNKGRESGSNTAYPLRIKEKTLNKKIIATKTNDFDSSSIYDAHFSYTPSFLLEEYRREDELARILNQKGDTERETHKLADDICDDYRKTALKRHSLNINLERKETAIFQSQDPDQTAIPPRRRRAQSLQVFSEAFPTNLPSGTYDRNDILLRTGRIPNLNRRINSLPDANRDLPDPSSTAAFSLGLYADTSVKDAIKDKDALAGDRFSRRLSIEQTKNIETMEDKEGQYYMPHGPTLKLTSQGLLEETLSANAGEISTSSAISAWIDRPHDIDLTHARRMSICTDKLHYKVDEDGCLHQQGSSIYYERGKTYGDGIDETCNHSSIIEGILPSEVSSEGHLCSPSNFKRFLNYDRMATSSNLLLRRKSNGKNEIPNESIHNSLKTSNCVVGSTPVPQDNKKDVETPLRESSQSIVESAHYSGGYNLDNIYRGNDRKTIKDNISYIKRGKNDKESSRDDQRFAQKNQAHKSLNRTVSFENYQNDTNDKTMDDAHSELNSNKDEFDKQINNDDEHEDQITSSTGGRGFPRGKQLLKNIFLEASAKQLTSCLKSCNEENESATVDEHFRPSSGVFTLRRSIGEINPRTVGPPHNAEDGSFRASPTSAPPRRAGNFFLVASALKSGQPPNRVNFRRDRNCRRSVSCVPSDHPCALADYKSRTTSVRRLADAHALLQRSALCLVEKDKDFESSDKFI